MKSFLLIISIFIGQWAKAQLDTYEYAGHWPYGPGKAVISHAANDNQYVLFGEGGVLHVALVNPMSQPQVLTSFSLLSPIEYMAISPDGTQLALSDKDQWVTLLNISTLSSPYLLGRFDFRDSSLPANYQGGSPYGMAFKDNNTLITAVSPKGLFAFDVSDPLNIQIIGEYIELGTDFVWDVGIYNDHAWVADDDDGLSVIDVSNLSQMSLVFRDSSYDRLTGIRVVDDKAYLTRGSDGIKVIELSTTPVISATITVNIDDIGFVTDIAPMDTDKIVVADFYDGLKVYDITAPMTPVLTQETNSGASKVTVHDQIAHVITPTDFYGDHELESHDFSATNRNGAVSTPLQALPLIQNSINIFSDDRYVLATTDFSGLALLSIGNPAKPQMIAWLYPEEDIWYGAILGDLVLAKTSSQLLISDISDPSQVIELPRYDLAGSSSHTEILVISDTQVIVGDDNNGLKWLEILQNGVVTELSTWSDGSARKFAKNGNILATAAGLSFSLIDYTNLNNPQTLFTHTLNRPIHGLATNGNHLYIANDTDGLSIWDISNPNTPSEVAVIDHAVATIKDVDIFNNIAFMAADKLYGMLMYDINDPTMPVYISRLSTPGSAVKITVSEKVLAVADEFSGVFVFSNDLDLDLIFAHDFETNQ